jgi:CRISPR-associated endonuclease Cas2
MQIILVCYDISNIKVQAKVRKYLKKYGMAIQYSMYEISLSGPEMRQIISEIKYRYTKLLKSNDSIIILPISSTQVRKTVFIGKNSFNLQSFVEL